MTGYSVFVILSKLYTPNRRYLYSSKKIWLFKINLIYLMPITMCVLYFIVYVQKTIDFND